MLARGKKNPGTKCGGDFLTKKDYIPKITVLANLKVCYKYRARERVEKRKKKIMQVCD